MIGPILFAIWVLIEMFRLYVGYVGNLQEQTPNLAAFLFLTIFPQFFIMVYFTMGNKYIKISYTFCTRVGLM
jgi:hypothetical protein